MSLTSVLAFSKFNLFARHARTFLCSICTTVMGAHLREVALMERIAKNDANVQRIVQEIQEIDSRARAWGGSLLPVQMQVNMKAKKQQLRWDFRDVVRRLRLRDELRTLIAIQDAGRAEDGEALPRLKKALLPFNPLAIEPQDDGGLFKSREASPNMSIRRSKSFAFEKTTSPPNMSRLDKATATTLPQNRLPI
jgi:hypothetical protein